jgi:hypothetical protein
VAIDAEGLHAAVGEDEVEPGVVECGIRGVDDGVVVWAKERKVFHGVRAAARAVPDVVRFGRIHCVKGWAIEGAELAAAGVEVVQVVHELAVARCGAE